MCRFNALDCRTKKTAENGYRRDEHFKGWQETEGAAEQCHYNKVFSWPGYQENYAIKKDNWYPSLIFAELEQRGIIHLIKENVMTMF